MNIKTSDSAAKNKMFLGFWFVMFASLILLVNWLLHLPLNNSDLLINKLSETDKYITELTSLHAKYLLKSDKEDNLFISGEIPTEEQATQIIRQVKNNIAAFRESHRLTRKKAIISSVNEFEKTLIETEFALNNLMLITKERGNKNSGIVQRWLNLSQGIFAMEENNKDLASLISKIKAYESQYLLDRNIKTLQDISVLAEELLEVSTNEEYGFNIGDLDQYIVLTGNLVSIENRMGHNSAQGIIPDLEKALERLTITFGTMNHLIVEQASSGRIFWIVLRYLIVALIIGMFVYLFIYVFSLIDPLQQLAGFTDKIAEGKLPYDEVKIGKMADMQIIKMNLNKHVTHLQDKLDFIQSINADIINVKLNKASDNDLIGDELIKLQNKIVDAADKQAKNEADNEVRRYLNEGLARFADILRSRNNDIHKLGDAFIREMVKYMNALQGGFFIYDDSEKSAPVLNLISAFAYNRKKYLQQTIAFGEGLIGTCAREKQPIHLTEIPEGYISITSGLGDTPPSNLLLAPVLHENEILGVIEIASLNHFRDHEIDFAKQVALSLGATLVNTRNNQRTSELLNRSQQQALEMAEQEEEMRQNMEELKATQEESNRREEEYKGVADAITSALMIVEYDTDGHIIHVNDKLCLFLAREREEMIGKTHHEVFEGNIITDADFWNEIQNSGSVVYTETVHVGKKTSELVEHFSTIYDRGNHIIKYINFATNGRIGNS